MTGYSRARSEDTGFSVSVAVKSINHRFLDLQLRLPPSLDALEGTVRRLVREHVVRGHVEVSVSLERTAAAVLQLSHPLLAAYAGACQQLHRDYGFAAQADPVALLRIPGIIAGSDGDIPSEEMERIARAVERAASEALESLNQMRAREGEALERDLRGRLAKLASLAVAVEKLAAQAPALYQQRLQNRLGEMLGSVSMDPGRLNQEVAYLASRADISEELTRFHSHVDQVQRFLDESAEVGKKLDFLLQEMNREANTLLSKTTDVPEVGRAIAGHAIEMKTEIEKLREQALNIE
ncbi:MAG: YicC/YloC family endoribonuclease [Terriglobia bacterium]